MPPCPCTECTCGESCQCAPDVPGCDPCGAFQAAKAAAAQAAAQGDSATAAPVVDQPTGPVLALPAPEDVQRLINIDVSSGQAVVLDQFGPVVVNTDGTLSRITNWDRMSEQEQEVAKRRISKRNVERLRAFHEAGDLKEELVSALQPQEHK